MIKNKFDIDVIVIGGGSVGLASALAAAKLGQSVTVLEQFEFGNQNGSSAGHVRMWRAAITEPSHAKLAFEAEKMYIDLERETGEKFLYRKGLLNFGVETNYTEQGTIETAYQVLKSLGKNCIKYNKKQLETRFPFKNLPENYFAVYSEDNAVIDVKKFIKLMISENKKYGVDLHENEKVIDIKSEVNGVVVETNNQIYYAKKAIVTPGPYTNEITRYFNFKLNILFWNMSFAYYKITNPSLEFPMWFQFDTPDKNNPSKLFYGFPPVKFGREGFVRLAVDWASHKFSDISQRHYLPGVIDIDITRQYVEKHMRGVSSMPIDMTTAVQAQMPDNLSVLDFMPEQFVDYHKNIVLFSGGWAYKFIPLFGKICADLAIYGETKYDYSEFSILRKNIIQQNERGEECQMLKMTA